MRAFNDYFEALSPGLAPTAGYRGDGHRWVEEARAVDAPDWLWPRDPPIRVRKSVPDSWLELTITEGRNRQVRRMTAAVGFPTLRLIRYSVGAWTIDGLDSGEWREV